MTTSLFPTEHDIPHEYQIPATIDQRHYLCNGEMREWTGPRQDVLSPIWISTPNGFVQKSIGSYPLLDEENSLELLEAACAAYDHGRGVWPMMPVEERIRHVEVFTHRMIDNTFANRNVKSLAFVKGAFGGN